MPTVIPFKRYFWKEKKTINMGMAARVEATMISE
jgi:hypothetical protein